MTDRDAFLCELIQGTYVHEPMSVSFLLALMGGGGGGGGIVEGGNVVSNLTPACDVHFISFVAIPLIGYRVVPLLDFFLTMHALALCITHTHSLCLPYQ